MKILVFTLVLAIYSFAAQYGVMSICTKIAGVDYCHLVDGVYRTVDIQGTIVVATGFTIHKFFTAGQDTVFMNSSKAKIRYRQVVDDKGFPYMMFESAENLWLADTSGCITIKYVTGDSGKFRRMYKFEEVDSMDTELGLIEQCRELNRIKEFIDKDNYAD